MHTPSRHTCLEWCPSCRQRLGYWDHGIPKSQSWSNSRQAKWNTQTLEILSTDWKLNTYNSDFPSLWLWGTHLLVYDGIFLSCKLKLLLGQADNAGIAWEPQPRVGCNWLYASVSTRKTTLVLLVQGIKKKLMTEWHQWHQQKTAQWEYPRATSAYPLCTAALMLSKQHWYQGDDTPDILVPLRRSVLKCSL